MAISKEDYARLARRYAPPSPLWQDCVKAFLCGGALGVLLQKKKAPKQLKKALRRVIG